MSIPKELTYPDQSQDGIFTAMTKATLTVSTQSTNIQIFHVKPLEIQLISSKLPILLQTLFLI